MSKNISLKDKVRNLLFLESRRWRIIIRAIWIFVPSVVILFIIYIRLVVANPYDLFGPIPSLNAIQNPETDISSEVISADGVSLGRFFRYNRSLLRYEDFPPMLVNTLITSEDHRFRQHSGMDFWSYLRVVYGLVTFNPQGGGSTLTQQTAKNLFKTREDDMRGVLGTKNRFLDLFISKTKEWVIAIRLEETFTKDELIALYLNTVPFSNNSYGIKIAAETYFEKSVNALNIQEVAVLVGLLQNNSAFDPVRNPNDALLKRNQVLSKLVKHGHIKSDKAYDSIAALPIKLNFRVQNHNRGLATYFRTQVQKEMNRWCREHGYDLLESGLKIYTTIDSRVQYLAEEAMKTQMKRIQRNFDNQWGERNPWTDSKGKELAGFLERKLNSLSHYVAMVEEHGKDSKEVEALLHEKRRMRVFTWDGDKDTLFSTMDSLRYYNRFLHAGLMAMDPRTGEVKAWVGGINHRQFKYDHVLQSKRQPGSTFKSFVYGKAMEDGYSPCAEFPDISPMINIGGKIYHPVNSNGTHGDGTIYTLRRAMAKSLNSVTMQLMEKLQPKNVADFAHRLGIESPLDPVYALGLGTSDVSLFELVGSYTAFVNDGIYTRPYYITRIEDKHGNVLETFIPESRQVISKETADKMIYMLKGAVEEDGGTSRGLSDKVLIGNEVGGKTGTTDNASDAWYVGVTSSLITGVWVGGDERSIHFENWKSGSGGSTALPLWNTFMEGVYNHPETGIRKGPLTSDDSISGFDCHEVFQ